MHVVISTMGLLPQRLLGHIYGALQGKNSTKLPSLCSQWFDLGKGEAALLLLVPLNEQENVALGY